MIGRLLGLVGGGLLLAGCFPPYSLPMPLALIAIAVFVAALRDAPARQRAGFGLVFGASFFMALLSWLRVVGPDAWVAVALICTAWWVLAALASRSAAPFQIALLFTSAELLRDRLPWGGFGWGQVGILLADTGRVASLLQYIGQVGATWLIWFGGAHLAKLWADRRASALPFWILVAALTLVPASAPAAAASGGPTIALVQGGVDNTGLGNLGDARAVLRRHADLTIAKAAELASAALVVWPENSVDVDPYRDAAARQTLRVAQAAVQVPLLAGAVLRRPDGRAANSSLLVDGTGLTEVYAKQRLVPFGEFMPLRNLIEAYTSRAELMPVDFQPGANAGWVGVADQRIGLLICFEVADDNLAWDRDLPVSGLVVQTNNATYDGLGQSEQQMLYARTRAIENDVPVFVASTNGASAVIDPTGRLTSRIAQADTGWLRGAISSEARWTVAARIHDAEVLTILLGAALVLTFSLRRRVRF